MKALKKERDKLVDSYDFRQLTPDCVAAWLACAEDDRVLRVGRSLMLFESHDEIIRVMRLLDRGSRRELKGRK